MKFGPVPVAQALGGILAHSLGLGSRRLKKGRILTELDIADIAASGLTDVTIARPDDDDVLEDQAAARIAAALSRQPHADGLSIAAPFTGRANIFATCDGMLEIDAQAVADLNAIDEAITLATLHNHARVSARQMLATVKIIPYGAPDRAVAQAEAIASSSVLKVHSFKSKSAHLILTRTPGMKEKLLTKGADAVRRRIAALGISDHSETVVDHNGPALTQAIHASGADLTLILTGSATSDRGDVGPQAVISAGGELLRFGMPVDPGNLLFLGSVEGRPVVGLPGCARSPKLNGADWVLERLAAGLEIGALDIAAMGVGGLLKEISSRPEPRVGGAAAPLRPRISAILLAAGASTRMRGRDKLLEQVDGKPLLRIVADRLLASAVDDVVCVLPPEAPDRHGALAGLAVRKVENPRAAEGMGTSIAAGVAALDGTEDAVLLVLGDMPGVTAQDVDRLLAAFDPAEDRSIVRSTGPGGAPGQPVLFGKRFFEALRGLDGDVGARQVVAEHPEYVVDVMLEGQRALTDLDTPEAWAAWRAAEKV